MGTPLPKVMVVANVCRVQDRYPGGSLRFLTVGENPVVPKHRAVHLFFEIR